MPKPTAQLIDGKALAEKILLELKGKIARLKRPPGLAVILIGADPASHLYVKNKKKASQKIGLEFHEYLCNNKCRPNVTEPEILETIDFLNNDPATDGIIVQLPLPKEFNTEKIINRILPAKDVDGFHPLNQKKILAGNPLVIPPVIGAVNAALQATGENLAGKTAVIIAKNPVFSEPLKKDLTRQGLRVKITSPADENLNQKTRAADLIVAALGQKHFLKKAMVKPDAIIIDIGTNLSGKNKWSGDVDPKVAEVAGWLTPVPGGIGPLTVAYLLKNTFELAKRSQ